MRKSVKKLLVLFSALMLVLLAACSGKDSKSSEGQRWRQD